MITIEKENNEYYFNNQKNFKLKGIHHISTKHEIDSKLKIDVYQENINKQFGNDYKQNWHNDLYFYR